jgi:hypothetical protein
MMLAPLAAAGARCWTSCICELCPLGIERRRFRDRRRQGRARRRPLRFCVWLNVAKSAILRLGRRRGRAPRPADWAGRRAAPSDRPGMPRPALLPSFVVVVTLRCNPQRQSPLDKGSIARIRVSSPVRPAAGRAGLKPAPTVASRSAYLCERSPGSARRWSRLPSASICVHPRLRPCSSLGMGWIARNRFSLPPAAGRIRPGPRPPPPHAPSGIHHSVPRAVVAYSGQR